MHHDSGSREPFVVFLCSTVLYVCTCELRGKMRYDVVNSWVPAVTRPVI